MAYIWQTVRDTIPSIELYFLAIAVFVVAEQLFPAERSQPVRNQLFNARYTVFFLLISQFIIFYPKILLAKFTAVTGNSQLINLDHWQALGTGVFTRPIRYLALPFVPFLVYDFFYYWHHRFQHTLPVLWEQHKLHHTDETLSCVTNQRHHWLEEGIRVFTISIPMMHIVAFPGITGTLIASAIAQWSVFIHANIRISMGPLTPVLAGPQLHRIHHSKDPRHVNHNYAAFFPIWDVLFGTYYRPLRGEWPATGLADGETVHSIAKASMLPFQGWARMLTRKRVTTADTENERSGNRS